MSALEFWPLLSQGPLIALASALLLGLVHGITPDEHTWPITFSYAVGGYSTRAGLRAGLLFSLSFTVQRAIGSELSWYGLTHWLHLRGFDALMYLPVGGLMLLGGWLMQRQRRAAHLHLFGHCAEDRLMDRPASDRLRRLTGWMPAIHGFVAGWGFGAFALILYTTLAPAMPSAAVAWLPGALFGIGTGIVQAAAGALFGRLALRRGLDAAAVQAVALTTATRTLSWGGLAYVLVGVLGLLAPHWAGAAWETGLAIPGLHHLGLPFLLVVFVVLGVGVYTLLSQIRAARRALARGEAPAA